LFKSAHEKRKKQTNRIEGSVNAQTDARGTGVVGFYYGPYTQEYTDSNEWKEAYFMEYKMVSK